MPISGTRRLMTGGWGNPKLDLKDPSLVLYTPLWYPDSETTGSTIISKDKNRHSCTVTGATWGNQGRTFDGTADFLGLGDLAIINSSLTAATILIWFKCSGTNKTGGNYHWMLAKGTGTWMSVYLIEAGTSFTARARISSVTKEATVSSLSTGTWYFGAGVFDGSTIDASIDAGAAQSTAASGTLDDPSGTALEIGRAGTEYTWGVVGEVMIYDRALSAAEILYHYQTTRWRFS